MTRTLILFLLALLPLISSGCSATDTCDNPNCAAWGSRTSSSFAMRPNASAPDAAHMATELVAIHEKLGAESVSTSGSIVNGIWPRHYVVTLNPHAVIFVTLDDTKGGFSNDLDYVTLSLYAQTKGTITREERAQLNNHFYTISNTFRARYEAAQQAAEATASLSLGESIVGGAR